MDETTDVTVNKQLAIMVEFYDIDNVPPSQKVAALGIALDRFALHRLPEH